MSKIRIQVFVEKTTKEALSQIAKSQERSESFIAGRVLDNALAQTSQSESRVAGACLDEKFGESKLTDADREYIKGVFKK